jgi:hypothetical protein
MKPKLILSLVVIFVAGTAMFAQEHAAVTTPYGQFTFNATVEVKRYLGQTLKGTIINNTTKDWMKLEFAVDYYDKSGKKIDVLIGKTVVVPELKKGDSYSIGHGFGEMIVSQNSGRREAPIVRYEVTFKGGTIPATYSFVLLQKKVTAKADEGGLIESPDLQYSDDLSRFVFSISKRQIGFVLQNKTDDPIEIDWNKVAFVDVSGESHKVMHSGVKYVNRNESLAPTTIPPTAKLEDIVFPTDYVYFEEGEYGGWRETPLFPDGDRAASLKGQTFVVFIPMRMKGVVKNYSFRFKIADVIL